MMNKEINMKKCEGCIWLDMCGCDDVCEDLSVVAFVLHSGRDCHDPL